MVVIVEKVNRIHPLKNMLVAWLRAASYLCGIAPDPTNMKNEYKK